MRRMISLLCIVICNVFFINAQQNELLHFQGSKSYGIIPDDFLLLTTQKIEKYKTKSTDVYNENKDFIIKSFFKIDQLLLSGRVAFGDPVTAYINQVADEILKDKPELHVQLKFYHIKSPQLNASSTPQGIILVNTGAFAYLQNEAQLAFILCHEIAHYVKDHALNSYTENQQALKGKGIYGSISLDEQIELYFNHSHEKEMEADSLGVALFLETGYDPAEITSALHLFHYYYLPFGNKPFNVNFFNKEEFTIPYIYFKDSLSPVSIVEKESDEYKTHPNISKRKTAVDSLLYGKHLSGSKYLVSEPSFKNLSTFCRFESLRLDILQKNYTKALYSSYLLLDEYPGNEFLETCIAKSLYGLTKFRNSEEFHLVTKPYSKVEGESQQLYYMFRQISPVQLNTLALKYVHDIRKKYPASGVLNNIESELIDELVTNHEVKFEDFHEVPKRFEYPQMEELNQLTQSDLISWKNKCGDFYLNAFYSDLKDTALIRKFGAAAVKLEQSKNEEQLTYKEKEKRKQAYEAMLREKGFPEKYNKAIIVDPLYIDLNLDSERSFTNSQKYKLLLDEVVNEFKLNFNIDVKLLSMRDLDENSISSYNQLCEMKEWRDELLTNNTCKHMPLSTVTDSRDDAEKVILCFPVILKDNGIEYYRISYYDYHTGNQIFTNSASLLSFNSVKDLFYKDLIILTKK